MDGLENRVEVATGLRSDLLKRHRKDGGRAKDAWAGRVAHGRILRRDAFYGTQIPKDRFPHRFERFQNLWKLDLPYAFRAVYTVMGRPGDAIRIVIHWIGDHKEYDRLFGYG